MRTIAYLPLLTYPDATTLRAAQAAVGMAAAIGADVDANIFIVDLPRAASTFGAMIINVSELIQKVENDSCQYATSLASAVQEGAGWHSLAMSLETRVAAPTEAFTDALEESRYRDLSIIPWAEHNLTSRELAEAIIFGSGRPVLVVPENHQPVRIGHIALAWDGSRVAARALADASRFLADGARVTILTAGDEKQLEPNIADRLVDSLSRRGLKASALNVSTAKRPIGLALQEACRDIDAGLLVMGGYGHTRLRDFIVGGATRGVLASLSVPVLISH